MNNENGISEKNFHPPKGVSKLGSYISMAAGWSQSGIEWQRELTDKAEEVEIIVVGGQEDSSSVNKSWFGLVG